MSNKAVIGGISSTAARADAEQKRADEASSELTIIKRRIRTFYDALSEVYFPANAPTWAPDWREWLLTGEVVPAEEPTPEVVVVEEETPVVEETPGA